MDNSYFSWKQNIVEEEKGPYNPPSDLPDLIRTKETGDKVYLIKDGYLHWITSPGVLKGIGGSFDVVKLIDKSVFRQLRQKEKITEENMLEYKLTTSFSNIPQNVEETSKGISEKINNVGQAYEVEVADPLHEFKQYPSEEINIESAPKAEPKKGFTSIIIPVFWNNYPVFHYTGNCIGSIREHTDKNKTPYEIILVINGKTAITVDRYELTYADKIVALEENVGFAKAVNKGIRVAKGEYIAIVNNDVMVYNKWLELLQTALNQPEQLSLVMATPMYGKPFARAIESYEEYRKWEGKLISESFSDFTDFSCVLTRKEIFAKIGLFDEQFFMYGEDLDILRRMKEAGLKYASTKAVATTHIIGATSSSVAETPQIMNESKEKLKQKWGY